MGIQKAINDLDKLYESVIELDTPYMLRNDGKLFSCKDLMIHPYINTLPTSTKNKIVAYKFLLDNGEEDNYKWFLKNSSNLEVKDILQKLLNNEVRYSNLDGTLNRLRYLTNQEFCRVRTSGKFLGNSNNKEIYFRISSFNFNWFDLIWQIIAENKNLLEYITICTDIKAKGYDEVYTYKGIKLDHLPIEDFLTLPGQPVIEYCEDENKATTAINEELEFTFIDRR